MNSVLVVDDDQSYLELVLLTLQDDCGVAHARGFPHGAALLRHLSADETPAPSLLILDLHMRGMDGIELLRHVRAVAPEVPVAFLSGAAGHEERAACLAAGAAAFVTKPVAYGDLVQRLQELVRSVDPATEGRP